MNVDWFFIYFLPVFLVLSIGLLGSTRRIGFIGALVCSILLTPIGGFIVALLSGPRRIVIPGSEPEKSKKKKGEDHGKR